VAVVVVLPCADHRDVGATASKNPSAFVTPP
jgi:hypothetical protein